MKNINDYNDPFEAIDEFEKALSKYTGAPGVILTDSCTHAIELALRASTPDMYASIPAHTYISVRMTLEKLSINYTMTEDKWNKAYSIGGTKVWDYARAFEQDMYCRGEVQCLSFGHGKQLEIGHGGAILTDNKELYEKLKKASYDGRDPEIKHWKDQKEFDLGFHYMMRPEDAAIGLNKLENNELNEINGPGWKQYPDLRNITINKDTT
jgi:dTDP-4-amino-4,6-dideoxygalactose transaminase